MNKLYDLLELSIKEGSSQSNKQICEIVSGLSYQEPGTLFGLHEQAEYIVKRYVRACCSSDSSIRNNSVQGLQMIQPLIFKHIKAEKFIEFVGEISNFNRACYKRSEKQANCLGRLLIFKRLHSIANNSSQAYKQVIEIMAQFPDLQAQAIEVCYSLCHNKLLRLKFHSITPKTSSSRFLYRILLHQMDSAQPNVSEEEAAQQIESAIKQYPKQSIALQCLGKYLPDIVESVALFFNKYSCKFFDQDHEADIHEIYYVLTIFKHFLQNVTIDSSNAPEYFQKGMVAVWLEQLRVTNKKMRNLAQSISINFQEQSDLAFTLLQQLHESDIYLQNISSNHPLVALYRNVGIDKYWNYLFNICQEQAGEMSSRTKIETEAQFPSFTHFKQFEFFIKLRRSELSTEQFSMSLTLVLNHYRNHQQSKQMLFSVLHLMNILYTNVRHKKMTNCLNKESVVILKKLEWQNLSIQQEQKKVIKGGVGWLNKRIVEVEKGEQPGHAIQTHFLYFFGCVLGFCLIYPEEADTVQELRLAYPDLLKLNIKAVEGQLGKPRKRVKKSEEGNIDKKPVHVLVDIFISLMTKPPQFLRNSIHTLYGDLIEHLEAVDLESMLTVVTTPDAEFIEEM